MNAVSFHHEFRLSSCFEKCFTRNSTFLLSAESRKVPRGFAGSYQSLSYIFYLSRGLSAKTLTNFQRFVLDCALMYTGSGTQAITSVTRSSTDNGGCFKD